MVPADDSARDGYAIIAAMPGATKQPRRLSVGEIRASESAADKVTPGTAIRIMTGAPIPQTHSVVQFEDMMKKMVM